MKKLFVLPLLLVYFFSCSSPSDNEEAAFQIKPLPAIANVSLGYRPSSETVSLPRDVETEGAVVTLKKGVSWINNVRLSSNKILFDVEENTTMSLGHRFDTILVSVKGQVIGTVCVTQARNPVSDTRLAWASSNALYRDRRLYDENLSGLEMTKLVYNLEKTTNGKDSYKNYPAFAFCIEMNHDPEHNMEWHLPSEDEIMSYRGGQTFKGTPLAQHNYWWTSSENYSGAAFNVYSVSTTSRPVSKTNEWWVIAFRNGNMEEYGLY